MPVRSVFPPLSVIACLPFAISACGGNATSPETNPNLTTSAVLNDTIELSSDRDENSTSSADSDDLQHALAICSERLNTSPEDLLTKIQTLTGLTSPRFTTDALGTEGLHTIWANDGDVICLDSPSSEGGVNLLQSIEPGQIVFGSSSTDYVAEQNGGVFLAGAGDDFVATLSGGLFYGEEGNDRVDSPVTARIYDGWQFADVESRGATGGRFIGGVGDDHIGALNGAEFLGQDGSDSASLLLSGDFFGGEGRDSISDPAQVRLGHMSGGRFYGETGDDWVDIATGGKILGGSGDDTVQAISAGRFEGMEGNDTVYSLIEQGSFNGGSGNDAVDSMNQGTYDGGDGTDSLQVYSDGEVTNVESVPTCLQQQTNLMYSKSSRCLASGS